MNIVMPALHSTPSFDPFSSSSPYPNYQETALFPHQEHFTHFAALPPSLFSPDSSQQQQQQVDPMWLSGYPAHGHIQQQQQPLHIIPPSPAATTTSDFLNEDVILNDPLAKSTSATTSSAAATTTTTTTTSTETTTTFAGPLISIGSRPQRPLPRRFHSLSTTMQRRPTADQAQTNNNSRFSRQTLSRLSPQKSHSPPAFSSYATHSHSSQSPPDPHDSSRATKRRRTNDSVLHQQPFSTASTSPMHAMTPTHLHDHHGFGTTQTWAGPPTGHIASATAMHPITGHHHPPGLTTAAAAPHWSSVGVHHHPFYPTDPSQHAYHELSPDGVIHTPMLPFESPASHHSGSPYYASPQQAGSPSAGSVHSSYVKKTEPGSPSLNADAVSDVFTHPPTDFPPRPYPGGPDAKSPWTPVKPVGKIFGSRLEQMPAIEKRLAKLEENLDHYLDARAAQALKNSQLPGLSFDSPPIQAKPTGPSRLFGGRIWPTALARRVRRTPRD